MGNFNNRNLPTSAFYNHSESLDARIRRAAVQDGRELFGNDGDAWPSSEGRPAPIRSRPSDVVSRKGEPAPQFSGLIKTCPLGKSWRLWDMLGSQERDFRYLSPAELEVCARARRLLPLAHRGFVDLEWEVAADDSRYQPLTSDEFKSSHWPGSPQHRHAETTIDGHRVHVDLLSATHGGPGRMYRECRIFVDGRLAGRGGTCGCGLGFGGKDLPAVAAVRMDAAITVDEAIGGRPIVELWHAHLVGSGRQQLKRS